MRSTPPPSSRSALAPSIAGGGRETELAPSPSHHRKSLQTPLQHHSLLNRESEAGDSPNSQSAPPLPTGQSIPPPSASHCLSRSKTNDGRIPRPGESDAAEWETGSGMSRGEEEAKISTPMSWHARDCAAGRAPSPARASCFRESNPRPQGPEQRPASPSQTCQPIISQNERGMNN